MDTWLDISNRHDRQYRKISVLAEQQNHRCCYCGVTMVFHNGHLDNRNNLATIDHVIPISDGGQRGYHNEVAACRMCNNLRASDDALQFYEWRIKHPSHRFNYVKKALNQYRKRLEKEHLRAQRAEIATQIAILEAIPNWLKMINRLVVWMTPRKYPQSQEVADSETGGDRPRLSRGSCRTRHRDQNPMGNFDSVEAELDAQTRI